MGSKYCSQKNQIIDDSTLSTIDDFDLCINKKAIIKIDIIESMDLSIIDFTKIKLFSKLQYLSVKMINFKITQYEILNWLCKNIVEIDCTIHFTNHEHITLYKIDNKINIYYSVDNLLLNNYNYLLLDNLPDNLSNLYLIKTVLHSFDNLITSDLTNLPSTLENIYLCAPYEWKQPLAYITKQKVIQNSRIPFRCHVFVTDVNMLRYYKSKLIRIYEIKYPF